MKKSVKIVLPLAVLVVAAVGLVCLAPKLSEEEKPSEKHYEGIVELWNVESFEGGSGSRSAWITARAAQFEKTHEGLYVHVTDLTQQQMKEKLNGGEKFDVVCFSRGIGSVVQPYLQPYTGSVKDVRKNFLTSGCIDGKTYALPLYAGSYFLFARTSQLEQNTDLIATALTNVFQRKVGKNVYSLQPLICGFTKYNSPLSALAMSGGKGKVNPDESVSQYEAYEKFIGNKTAVTLLGTQRDLYRLSQREKNGKIEALQCCALSGYNDLIQYLAVSAESEKPSCCMEFLQFLVSEQSQQTLVYLNLFSVLQQNYYTTERYAQAEQNLSSAYVPNVFGDEISVGVQRDAALKTLEM